MIERSIFQSAPLSLLRETGEFVDANDEVLSTPPSGEILLSRALCRFAFLLRPEGLSTREAESAALLHAEAHAPFASAGWAIMRSAEGLGVWWWDAERVAQLIAGRAPYRAERLIPESIAHSGDGPWRQVRTADGYEAQYHQAGALRASLWRRRPFDVIQWRLFCETVSGASVPGPEAPPTPLSPSWRRDAPWRRKRVIHTPPLKWLERGGWATTGVSLAAALVLLGQAARYNAVADQRRTAIGAMQADAVASASEAVTSRNVELARAAAAHAPLPEHLVAVADLLAAMTEAGTEITAWESSLQRVRAQGTGEVEVQQLGALLESNSRLRNVAPVREGGELVITADVQASDAGLSDGPP